MRYHELWHVQRCKTTRTIIDEKVLENRLEKY